MFTSNPYAQAGWYNPQNPLSINNAPWNPNASHPPTYGALPPLDYRPASVLAFTFASFNPDVFNCIVTGPKDKKYFDIRSNSGNTIIMKPGGQLASIHWDRHPSVEVTGILPRQYTKDFLKLSSDHTYRDMVIGNKVYAWIPRGSHGIYLYSHGPNPPEQFARISLSSDNTKIFLEMTSEAFQAGLFEPAIISTVLLFSARSID
ncbi:hypothetical protein BDN70DRAFT_898698 [Pholiota conissans]|uniref:Uncharacterized protein n=1 Tax=Pholiota conissans TaxID=109636 RepID=A0A9P6CVH4_9AGAR|nr:hypothetical protein BDN70DRAFT_898698 [Pholiota conissans]